MRSTRLVLFACLAVLLLGALVTLLAAQRAGLPNHIVRVIVVSAVGGVVGVLLGGLSGRRFGVWFRRVDRRTVVAWFVAAMVSGLGYSVVHEFGHCIFAVALGGTVESATWTIFSHAEPHVSYSHLPARAAPWASVGGCLFPAALALVLIAAWYPGRRWFSSLGTGILLIPAATMLVCNLGCIPEWFEQSSHIGKFTSYYGMGKMGEVLMSLLFSGASLAILIALLSALRNTRSASRE